MSHPSKFSEDIDYDALIMPLRFASLLLNSDAVMPFVDITARGELRIEQGPRKNQVVSHPSELFETEAEMTGEEDNGYDNWQSARHPNSAEQATINETTRERANLTIAQLAGMVEFALIPDEESGPNVDQGPAAAEAVLLEESLTREPA